VIGWVDGQAGASGDMLLGALVDTGVPLAVLQQAVDALDVEQVTLTATPVTRAGLGAVQVDVQAADTAIGRTWADVSQLIQRAALADPVRRTALEVFDALASAEAAVHRVPAEQVHFHEVGALDALADVVGAAAGLHHLGLSAVHCSPLSLGSGTTRGAHGPLPVPVPAVLALLGGRPVQAGGSAHEMTTPTGAALLRTVVTDWGPLPAMAPARTGHGAGSRDPGEFANVLRLVLGEPTTGKPPHTAVLLEANVDDMDPRLWPAVLTALLQAGASDAWLTPIVMKKGRPAHTLSVLCRPEMASVAAEAVLTHTSSIGLRESVVAKRALERTESSVLVDGQRVRVKTAWLHGEPVNASPEWEDVAAAALALQRPAKQVLAQAVALVQAATPPTPLPFEQAAGPEAARLGLTGYGPAPCC